MANSLQRTVHSDDIWVSSTNNMTYCSGGENWCHAKHLVGTSAWIEPVTTFSTRAQQWIQNHCFCKLLKACTHLLCCVATAHIYSSSWCMCTAGAGESCSEEQTGPNEGSHDGSEGAGEHAEQKAHRLWWWTQLPQEWMQHAQVRPHWTLFITVSILITRVTLNTNNKKMYKSMYMYLHDLIDLSLTYGPFDKGNCN